MATRNSWNNQVTGAGVTFTGGQTDIGTDAASNNINIGTGAAAKTITVGNTTGASVLALKYGTGDMTLASATGTVMSALDTGEITYPLQPAFVGYLPSNDLNQTGFGTDYRIGSVTALTELYDRNSDFNTNGTFTAPVNGLYFLQAGASVFGVSNGNLMQITLTTSNREYSKFQYRNASSFGYSDFFSCIADMDAGDTYTARFNTGGEAGNTDDVAGGGSSLLSTYMAGHLIC